MVALSFTGLLTQPTEISPPLIVSREKTPKPLTRGYGFTGGGATLNVTIVDPSRPSWSWLATRICRAPVAPKRITRAQPVPEVTVSGAVTDQVMALQIAVGSASLRSVTVAF